MTSATGNRMPLAVLMGIVTRVEGGVCPRCGQNTQKAACGHSQAKLTTWVRAV